MKFILPLFLALSLTAGAQLLPSQHLESAGQRWTYYKSAPASTGKALPLVLIFHGAGGSGGSFLQNSGWADKAKLHQFVAVAPSGLARDPERPPDFLLNPRVWNTGLAFLGGPRTNIDDSRFVLDMLSDLQSRHSIDPQRIYLAGHSNGATFASKLALTFPHQWAALAVIQGPFAPSLNPPARAIPTVAIFGEDDPILPPQGGTAETPWGPRETPSVDTMTGRWAQLLGLNPSAKKESESESQRQVDWGSRFVVHFVKGHGHSYPAPGQPHVDSRFGPVREEVNATDLAWDFFQNFPAAP